MLKINEAREVRKATNCDGPEQTFMEQDFTVEPSDIGRIKPHYLGFRYQEYKFKSKDVGRHIRVTSQPTGYVCWTFIS
jgi:hypothetical protein